MCSGQFNPMSRMIGESNFSKLDPVMGAAQRFDGNHVAPKVAGWMGQVPRGYTPPDSKNAAPKEVAAKPSIAERWGQGPAGNRGASGSLLTGQRQPTSKSLLGG
jgi:hypothetical protein